MNSLETNCLLNISSNLYLNYMILSKNEEWKIPEKICDIIFSFCSQNIEEFNENDLKLFSSSKFSILSLTINRKFYKFPQFFSKISTRKLVEINIYFDKIFCLECLKNLFKTKIENVKIFNIQFFIEKHDIHKQNVKDKVKMALRLIRENLGENLLELRINALQQISISEKVFGSILIFLEKNKTLKILEFQNWFCSTTSNKNALNDIRSIHRSLEGLSLTIPFNLTAEEIRGFFEKFSNLTTLSIQWSYIKEMDKSLLSKMKILLPLKTTLKRLETNNWTESVDLESMNFILENFKVLHQISIFSAHKCFSLKDDSRTTKSLSMLSYHKYDMKSANLRIMVNSLKEHEVILDKIILTRFCFHESFDENFLVDLMELSKIAKISQILIDISFKTDIEDCTSFEDNVANVKFHFRNNSERRLSSIKERK